MKIKSKVGEACICMLSYTKRCVYGVTLILTLFVYYLTDSIFFSKGQVNKNEVMVNQVVKSITEKKNEGNNRINTTKTITNTVVTNTLKMIQKPKSGLVKKKQSDWKIQIPVIGLDAEIAEGTSNSVMDQFVGHFEVTSKWNGNVGLAAHNRGYPVNYFQRIKQLQKGDLIIYTTSLGIRKYQVKTICVILDTDWTYLENTKDNRITLITCVENKPEYRRCIQAVEIK